MKSIIKQGSAIAAAIGAAGILAGCATFQPDETRLEQTDAFTNELDVLSVNLLAQPLSLQDAIEIAMTNNYEIRKADLDTELARLGRKTAFSAFLPQVTASIDYSDYDKDPLTSSQDFSTEKLNVGMPIFMPSTWFLYAAARHGVAAGAISAHYTRQSIALKTTQNYFNILIQQDLIKAYETQLAAATTNALRIGGLAQEGLFAKWEGDQAVYQAESREVQLNQAKRQLEVLRARFLADLGLDPGADFTLNGDTETTTIASLLPPAAEPDAPADPRQAKTFRASDASLEELVLHSLTNHPLLSLADRQVVMQEHAVRQAFCDFIPTLSAFATKNWTGNDVNSRSENLVMGFSGTWTIFNGFANVANVQANKAKQRKAELERENTFLSIIVNIVSADANLRDARDAEVIRKRGYDVAAAKFADYDAKNREGLIPLGDALDAQAAMDMAQVEMVKSRYQVKTALAALEFAAGSIDVPMENVEEK